MNWIAKIEGQISYIKYENMGINKQLNIHMQLTNLFTYMFQRIQIKYEQAKEII